MHALKPREDLRGLPYHGAAEGPEPPQQSGGEQEHQDEQSDGHKGPVRLRGGTDAQRSDRYFPSCAAAQQPCIPEKSIDPLCFYTPVFDVEATGTLEGLEECLRVPSKAEGGSSFLNSFHKSHNDKHES